MAAEFFIQYFKIHLNDNSFYFKPFFTQYLDHINNLRIKIKIECDLKKIVAQLRDSIIWNLYHNRNFIRYDGFKISDIQKLHNLLLSTRDNFDEHHLAQLYLINNLTNSKLDAEDDLSIFLNILESVFILDTEQTNLFQNEIIELFQNLKQNQVVKQSIFLSIKKILNIHDFNFDMSKLKLKVFYCDMSDLYGFVGLDTIYLNKNRHQTILKDFQLYQMDKERILKIFKLNFTRLFLNLSSHIVARNLKDNFNLSNLNDPSLKANLLELGIQAEKNIFTQQITWLDSALNSNLDIDYCYEFLLKILDGKELQFDFYRTHCYLSSEGVKYMGIDFETLGREIL